MTPADAGRLREWVLSQTHVSEHLMVNKTRLALVSLLCLVLWSMTAIAGSGRWEDHVARADPAHQRGDYIAVGRQIGLAVEDAKKLGRHDTHLAAILMDRGDESAAQGQFDEAVVLYKQALQIIEAVLGTDDFSVAASLVNLAAIHLDHGNDAEAEKLYMRALAIWENAPTG